MVKQGPLERKIKMATVFDQGDDSEVMPWPSSRSAAVYAAFVEKNSGVQPDPAEKATTNQLAALESRLSSGETPCADFAIWRPHGVRIERKLRLTIHHRGPDGHYAPHEVAGPPCFQDWDAAWAVFSFAMRALDAATRPRLDLYRNGIKKFADVFGDKLWWLLAQADQRMRGERWPILRDG